MTTTADLNPRARLIFGLAALAASLLPMIFAAGIVAPRPGSMGAPEWVVFLAGSTFFLAGWLILLPEGWLKTRGLLAAVLLSAFAAVFDWISFGPGERRFSGGVSIGPLFSAAANDEVTGRIVFGMAAVLMSVLAMCVWLRWLRALFAPRLSQSPDPDRAARFRTTHALLKNRPSAIVSRCSAQRAADHLH